MAQWLGVFAAFAEDLSSILSIYMAAYNYSKGELMPSSD